MANQKKQAIVDRLINKFGETTNFALIKYEKTSHADLESLRNDLKTKNASFTVVKNSMVEKAINKFSADKKSFKQLRDSAFPIKEKSAVLFLKDDVSAGLKALFDFSKKDTSIDFKVGIIDDVVYNGSDLKRIAQLPSREQLIAKITGSMKSPMARTTRAIKFNMQKMVMVLNAKAQQG